MQRAGQSRKVVHGDILDMSGHDYLDVSGRIALGVLS